MTRAASAALVVTVVALVWALLHVGWYPHGQIVDYPVYRHYGDAIVHAHAVPYRDFTLEYPPGALPAFIIPAYLEHWDFRHVFQVLMALCHVVLVLSVLFLAGRRAALLAAVAPLLLGSVVLSRFDLLPAALVAAALALLVRGNDPGSAVLFATAFAAKLWPAVLLPLIVVWLWRREGRRRAVAWTAAAAATAAAWFAPFVALSPSGVGHSFYVQTARPLQIESLGSSVLIALHVAVHTPLRITTSFGSQNLAGPGVQTVTVVTTLLEAAAILAVWVLFARGRPSTERLLVASAAAVTAVLAFGKVFSPQYLIWLIAFVPGLATAAAAGLFTAALVLTQTYFPRRYWDLGSALRWVESGVLLARNVAVVALFCVLAYAIQRSRDASSALSSSEVSARSGARTSG